MQISVPLFGPTPMTPDTVQVAMAVLQLNAMMAQDEYGLAPNLIDAAEECLQDYIQQVGLFEPPPRQAPAQQAANSIDTQQIANYLQAMAERGCGR